MIGPGSAAATTFHRTARRSLSKRHCAAPVFDYHGPKSGMSSFCHRNFPFKSCSKTRYTVLSKQPYAASMISEQITQV